MFKEYLKTYNTEDFICIQQIEKDKPIYAKYYKVKQVLEMNFENQVNLYFTPNTLNYRYSKEEKKGKISRSSNYLNYLQALYVDLDINKMDVDVPLTPVAVNEYIHRHILGSEVPEPTMIVCSGNGLHLYWKIHALKYAGNIEKWRKAQNYIKECFARFEADGAVSSDTVRLLRVPGTINKKEYGETQCYVLEQTTEIYNLDDIIEEYVGIENNIIMLPKKKAMENVGASSTANVAPVKYYKDALYRKRMKDLETLLIEFRDIKSNATNKQAATHTGKRECILFLYRYFALCVLQDKTAALEAVQNLNARLNCPLAAHEVMQATKSAETYYEGNGLHWRNSKIIDFLDMTAEEIEHMQTIISHAEKHHRKKKRDQKAYLQRLSCQGKVTKEVQVLQRQIAIYEMYYISGTSRQEIMASLNITKSTYYRDLATIRTEEWKALYKETLNKTMVNKPRCEIMQYTGTEGAVECMMEGSDNDIPKNFAPVIFDYFSLCSATCGTRSACLTTEGLAKTKALNRTRGHPTQ